MNEEKVRQIVSEMLQQQANIDAFTTSQTPNHTHNGLDSPRVSQSNIIPGFKYSQLLRFSDNGTPTSDFTLPGVYNATRLCFNGFITNDASDYGTGSFSPTKRAVTNGEVNFGEAYGFAINSTTISPFVGATTPFVQSCSSMFTDTSSLSNTRVSSSNAHFVYSTDSAGAVFASMQVIRFDSDSITIRVTLASDVQIIGALTIY